MLPQPAVPASATDVLNATGQTAYVTITGGTVSSIKVGPSGSETQVATATSYIATVPAGQNLNVTYSVAPSWYWSTLTPAVPASTTAVANQTGQDISVIIAAGTVTHVTVNGTDRATSSPANVMVPNGESISLAYSVAPVWAWMNYIDLVNNDSLGTAYASSNLVPATGVAGYDPVNDLPYAPHSEGGFPGFATGVSN